MPDFAADHVSSVDKRGTEEIVPATSNSRYRVYKGGLEGEKDRNAGSESAQSTPYSFRQIPTIRPEQQIRSWVHSALVKADGLIE